MLEGGDDSIEILLSYYGSATFNTLRGLVFLKI